MVIGPDVADLVTRQGAAHKDADFEANVTFAYPPQSQFNAESIEHFCFPSGIRLNSSSTPLRFVQDCCCCWGFDRSEPFADVDTLVLCRDQQEEFFVFMLSGGGATGQEILYACCLKGSIPLCWRLNDQPTWINVPICYCLVARIPYVSFFREVLRFFFGESLLKR